MDLSKTELKFLSSQGLKPSDVIDGRELSKRVREQRAREQNKTLILGGSCKKGSHRLKSRSGHCVQCKPETLGYQNRHRKIGYVYVAASKASNLTKVGCTSDLDARIDKINYDKYATANDWELLFWIKVREAGRLEKETQSKLRKFEVQKSYIKDGEPQLATETFSCTPLIAVNAISQAMEIGQHKHQGCKKLSNFEQYS